MDEIEEGIYLGVGDYGEIICIVPDSAKIAPDFGGNTKIIVIRASKVPESVWKNKSFTLKEFESWVDNGSITNLRRICNSEEFMISFANIAKQHLENT